MDIFRYLKVILVLSVMINPSALAAQNDLLGKWTTYALQCGDDHYDLTKEKDKFFLSLYKNQTYKFCLYSSSNQGKVEIIRSYSPKNGSKVKLPKQHWVSEKGKFEVEPDSKTISFIYDNKKYSLHYRIQGDTMVLDDMMDTNPKVKLCSYFYRRD